MEGEARGGIASQGCYADVTHERASRFNGGRLPGGGGEAGPGPGRGGGGGTGCPWLRRGEVRGAGTPRCGAASPAPPGAGCGVPGRHVGFAPLASDAEPPRGVGLFDVKTAGFGRQPEVFFQCGKNPPILSILCFFFFLNIHC